MKTLKRLLSISLAAVITLISINTINLTNALAFSYFSNYYENNTPSYTGSSDRYISDVYIIEEGYVEEYLDNLLDGRTLSVGFAATSNDEFVYENFEIDSDSFIYSTSETNVKKMAFHENTTLVSVYQPVTSSQGYSVNAKVFQGYFYEIPTSTVTALNDFDGKGLDLVYPLKTLSSTSSNSAFAVTGPYNFYYDNTYYMDDLLNDFTISYTNVPMDSCYLPSLTATWSDEEKEISLADIETLYDKDDFGYSGYNASSRALYSEIVPTKTGLDGFYGGGYYGSPFTSQNKSSFTTSDKSYNGFNMGVRNLEYYNLLGYDYANSNLHFDIWVGYLCKTFFSFYFLADIEVTTKPTKTSYIEGDTFDSSGMVIKGTYSDGETVTITDYSVDTTALTAGQTEVYVTYNGLYTTVPITVSAKSISSIAVTTQPSTTSYVVGQTFDDSGMTVTATYTDGTTAKIDNDLLTYTYSGGKSYFSNTNGEYITVSYGGKTAKTSTLTVAAKTITGLSVTTYPDKVSYYVGETFNSSGMKVTASYNDGSSAVISDYTISPSTVAADTTAVTVSKGGYSDKVKITVTENAVVGIEVTEQPNKTSYNEGESFNPDGMVVTATYSDGYEEEITDYSYSSLNGTGSVLIYVTYGSFYDTVTVNVAVAAVVTMTGITVSSAPTKTTYVAGENFDKSGMMIEATYSDGSTTEITDYSYSPTTLSESDTNIIVTYGNYYTTIPISVSAKEITKIEVTTAPSKTEYVQGEVFNPTDMIISATYSDGTTANLASSEYSYSAEALTTLGSIDFEISAANCTATTPITVIEKEISSISVIQYPDKVSYYDGQSFDGSGMVVQASYNDGSSAVISDYTVSPTVLTSGDTEITVSKDGYSDVVKISVSDISLKSISVTTPPTKTSYIAGQTFDSSGMV
ncbi:MAG: bacterial Ig-like domain-containing protein, partial [Clostridiales bacterium]|nr:bacterial Ig-like domain-containing protein [Clostridiales bacterium]